MDWKTIKRPGYFGEKRDEILKSYDEEYGTDNWRLAWQWGVTVVNWEYACLIYEQGYFKDSFIREELWKDLISKAKDVYDYDKSDVKSGLDYLVQNGPATHLQDIAIRRTVSQRGWRFEGKRLIQIRGHGKKWGKNLSPGKVKFHLPELIVAPHLEGWWGYDSIEDFYQSNKVLQVKESKE